MERQHACHLLSRQAADTCNLLSSLPKETIPLLVRSMAAC